jgi:hypothetical protein
MTKLLVLSFINRTHPSLAYAPDYAVPALQQNSRCEHAPILRLEAAKVNSF